jgi:cobalt-zinc-cadmium resistance protein CzcA
MIIIVVFLPLFSLEGLEGKMFKPMAFNIAFAMAGSLLLSLTLIPVLASMILKPKEERDTWLVRADQARVSPAARSARWPVRASVVITAAVALVASLALFPLLGKEFMPQLQEGSIMWRVTGIPSTSLDESIRTSKTIADAFKEFPGGRDHAGHDRSRREGRDGRRQLHGDLHGAASGRSNGHRALDQGVRRG